MSNWYSGGHRFGTLVQYHSCIEIDHEVCSSYSLPSTGSGRAVVSYFRKNVSRVLVHCLVGPSLLRKSKVRLTDCPDLTIAVYYGCQNNNTTISNKDLY